MKFYDIKLNGENLYEKYKDSGKYFTWLKLPEYFKTDEYKIYFTMYGLDKFITYDFENFVNEFGYTKDNFDITEIGIETTDRHVNFRYNTCLIYRLDKS